MGPDMAAFKPCIWEMISAENACFGACRPVSASMRPDLVRLRVAWGFSRGKKQANNTPDYMDFDVVRVIVIMRMTCLG